MEVFQNKYGALNETIGLQCAVVIAPYRQSVDNDDFTDDYAFLSIHKMKIVTACRGNAAIVIIYIYIYIYIIVCRYYTVCYK